MTENTRTPGVIGAFSERLSIRQRLVGAVILLLLLFGAVCVFSLVAAESVRSARSFSQQVNRVFLDTADLGEAISRQEASLRGYALSGRPRYLDTLDDMDIQFTRALVALQAALTNAPAQQQRLNTIGGLHERWRLTVADPIVSAVKDGDLASARERLIAGDSVKLIDPIRGALQDYREAVQSQLAASDAILDYRQQRARWLLVAMLLFGLFVGLLTVNAIIRRVTRPLTQLTDITSRLAAGERDIHVHFRRRRDEIGSVARALEHFRQIILEQDRQDWIRDHRARLSVLMQRFGNDRELGDQLLGQLAELCGAGYGALFTPASLADDETRFALLSRYGYSDDAEQVFAAGEGLVGQVLVTRRQILLEAVPEGYLPVRSGLGAARPSVLLIVPALVNDRVSAILELALFRQPSQSELDLLDTLMPNIGLAFMSLARMRRTAELLDQSRAQTQALTASERQLREQQDTLEKANTELRMQSEELAAQSEELRASEEELKVQSEELQATNEELRQKQDLMSDQQVELSRLHSESEQRAEALARASQYKSDFLANMSHELRTPLNSLLILSRSLADNDEGNLEADQIEAASIIHESGSNLLALINDILDLSKIEAGKMRVNAERCRIVDLVARLHRYFDHVAERKQLAFAVEIADDTPAEIMTDAGKLEQIVRNLVSNAIKFTEHGRVTVTFAPVDPSTVLRSEGLTPGDGLAVHVRDEGIGIPADRLEQIFQAFEQVDASTSRTYGGTGLGLSISRELARLLGGEVHVESRLGEGSCFSVYVHRELVAASEAGGDSPISGRAASVREPAVEYGAAITERPARPTPEPGRSPHLLIIDDDAVFARVVAEAARKRGFECTIAGDGERGLDMVRQQLPDAIVLDLGLPGMDGWAVLDRLKANERTCKIPVHIVSAADDTGRSQQSGAVGYLRKPISRDDLDTLFARAEALTGRQARRVLVVDDDREAHTAIAHLLKHERVEITAVTRGSEALSALDEQSYDCVVLDLRLPDISGFELLERIAARTGAPPVVVYSARELTDEETRTLRAHTDSIVIKGSHAQARLLDEISLFFHRIADASRTPAPVAAAERAAPETSLAGHTVLLVDDDMRNTFALSRVLRARGLNVLMASDGFKALDQLAAHDSVSIVLMDIMMPGMDGYEAIRRIRAQPERGELPIIALTAKAMAGDRDKCLEAGANDYLPKPLDTDTLVTRMQALL
ncbi:response regulator [Salinisphaera sp. T31B1]|uniref:response regulator n=1 Tax=Salinisphaera sp. T31B1 TaxID=727963 RepID=UPI00333F53AB